MVAVDSGKPVRIKDARHIRGAAGAEGERTVDPADDTAPNDDMTAVAVRITNEGLKADGSGTIRTGRSG